MAETQKIGVEIDSKLLKQLKVVSEHLHWSLEYLIKLILKTEMRRIKDNGLEELEFFVNDYFNFDELINELKNIGD